MHIGFTYVLIPSRSPAIIYNTYKPTELAKPYKSQIILAYESMVAHGLGPAIYLECLERVVDGCFTLRTTEPVQPGYWEILRILVYGAKRASSPPSAPIIPSYCAILWRLTYI